MTTRRRKFDDGDWFAVPLAPGEWTVGMLVRAPRAKPHVVAHFFAGRWSGVPALSDIPFTSPGEAVSTHIVSNRALKAGEWPVIGRRADWRREGWPLPPFMSWSPGAWWARRVDHDPDDLWRVVESLSVELKRDPLERPGAWAGATIETAIAGILAAMPPRALVAGPGSPPDAPLPHAPRIGDAFAVPLGRGRYAPGIVLAASSAERTMVVAIFAAVLDGMPTHLDLAGMRPRQALRTFACDDSRLRSGEWPFVGRPAGWHKVPTHLAPPVRFDEAALWAWAFDPAGTGVGPARRRVPLPYLVTEPPGDGYAGPGHPEAVLMNRLHAGAPVHPYVEGTWVAVPLGPPPDRRHAPALIARVAPDATAMMGYFFATAHADVPSLDAVAALRPDDAIEIIRFDGIDLIRRPWPVIGRSVGWDRSRWPVPPFLRTGPPVQHSDHRAAEWSDFWGGEGPPEPIEDRPLWGSPTSAIWPAFRTDEFTGAHVIALALDRAIREIERRRKLVARNKARRKPTRH
ncbi:MAG: hypothetical protein IPK81_19410 [Rhodospirillales bacterium]|nr:MAG: hypothetical protein IPK81_19410 [Rhodospirillales bacterium]